MPKNPLSPEIILVEGPSKTMKTTIGEVAASVLEEGGLKVVRRDAGSFFRVVTKAALNELAKRAIHTPTATDLDLASEAILDAEIPFDVERTWQGLHEPHIDSMVDIVSRAEHVQAASERWWDITADQATKVGADALVLDGRNPRDRLTPWLAANDSGVTLEIFCECDPAIAAERTLRGNGIVQPTDLEIAAMERSIVDRRYMDGTRSSLPYRHPITFVDYHPSLSAEDVVRQAYSEGKPEFPAPIRLDTGALERGPMNAVVGSLVLAVTSLVQ